MPYKAGKGQRAGTGHHHILLNKTFMQYGDIIPMDAQRALWKGDTVVTLDLPTGRINILQFANGMHMSMSDNLVILLIYMSNNIRPMRNFNYFLFMPTTCIFPVSSQICSFQNMQGAAHTISI